MKLANARVSVWIDPPWFPLTLTDRNVKDLTTLIDPDDPRLRVKSPRPTHAFSDQNKGILLYGGHRNYR